VQKSEEKEGNKRRKKGKENIWERRETGRKGKKEGRGGLACLLGSQLRYLYTHRGGRRVRQNERESQTTSQEMNDTHEE